MDIYLSNEKVSQGKMFLNDLLMPSIELLNILKFQTHGKDIYVYEFRDFMPIDLTKVGDEGELWVSK